MLLLVTIESIQDEAHTNGKEAVQVASWVKMNLWDLWQRYAQEWEKKCSMGTILFTKGDLIQLRVVLGCRATCGILCTTCTEWPKCRTTC